MNDFQVDSEGAGLLRDRSLPFGRRIAAGRPPASSCERLLVLLGDQLDPRYLSAAGLLEGGRPVPNSAVPRMEVAEEASHVASHQQRTALLLAAMRHFALALADRGVRLRSVAQDDPDNRGDLRGEIEPALGQQARPFTTFFWDFLRRHRDRLEGLGRMRFALADLDRLGGEEQAAIAGRAAWLRRRFGIADGCLLAPAPTPPVRSQHHDKR